MNTWTTEELQRIGEAEELQISPKRPDGSFRHFIPIWVVRTGDDVYVRSAQGPGNPWFREATATGKGRIRAGGIERDVEFTAPPTEVDGTDIDATYHAKYDRYGAAIVGSVVGPHSHAQTVRILPQG